MSSAFPGSAPRRTKTKAANTRTRIISNKDLDLDENAILLLGTCVRAFLLSFLSRRPSPTASTAAPRSLLSPTCLRRSGRYKRLDLEDLSDVLKGPQESKSLGAEFFILLEK